MSKSSDYVQEHWVVDSTHIEEYSSKKLFERILNGERERIINTPYGKIKIRLRFNSNVKFNCAYRWSGTRNEWQDDLEDQLMACVEDVLYSDVLVPFKDGQPLGGQVQNGDCLEFTFGNFVVENIVSFINGHFQQTGKLILPYRYRRYEGELHE